MLTVSLSPSSAPYSSFSSSFSFFVSCFSSSFSSFFIFSSFPSASNIVNIVSTVKEDYIMDTCFPPLILSDLNLLLYFLQNFKNLKHFSWSCLYLILSLLRGNCHHVLAERRLKIPSLSLTICIIRQIT